MVLFFAQIFILLQYIYPMLQESPKVLLRKDITAVEVVTFVR